MLTLQPVMMTILMMITMIMIVMKKGIIINNMKVNEITEYGMRCLFKIWLDNGHPI
jgi:hypothetical protein